MADNIIALVCDKRQQSTNDVRMSKSHRSAQMDQALIAIE